MPARVAVRGREGDDTGQRGERADGAGDRLAIGARRGAGTIGNGAVSGGAAPRAGDEDARSVDREKKRRECSPQAQRQETLAFTSWRCLEREGSAVFRGGVLNKSNDGLALLERPRSRTGSATRG